MRFASLRSWSLWTAQLALAALFLFAGIMKFVMPAEVLTASSPLPVSFYWFIGVAEALGGLGLILPGAFRIRRDLTPIAAVALAIIMSGAVGMTIQQLGVNAAILPGVIGLLCGVVAYGRRDWLQAVASSSRASVAASVLPSHV